MFLVQKTNQKISSLPVKELKLENIKVLGSRLAQKIVQELAKEPSHPRGLAKRLHENEQKIYYHIKRLEKGKIIEEFSTKIIQGATARIYGIREGAFAVRFKEFEETQKIAAEDTKSSKVLEPFIEEGKLNAFIIVGSPDPHGVEKARSRDGYYGMDLALFLGTYLNYIPTLNVKLDTEVREEDLQKNLILMGGPVVNTVTEKINAKLPIRFEKENNYIIKSTISGKEYTSDETGIIVKAKNPFNKKKSVLVIAGKRYAGTRAVIIAFLRYFNSIAEGNKFNDKIIAKVVEGVDLDSDGIVDDIEILE